jgi:hypothetical protein
VDKSYTDYTEELLNKKRKLTINRIVIQSNLGPITVDYFKGRKKTEELIFVFPVLGGRNIFANYFAEYFVTEGFDAAVVHRNNTFREPDNIQGIEEIFRTNIIRDRMVIDFFEDVHEKKKFGTFGISRGAINAAMTAGVDKRLAYNVLALGGADLIGIFKESRERGIIKFKTLAKNKLNMTEDEFFQFLEATLITDPDNLAKYIDARNTLIFLSLFDTSVPIQFGVRLRNKIGRPDTVFLPAGHATSLLYTHL